MPEEADDDVLAAVAHQIEDRFAIPLDALRETVRASPAPSFLPSAVVRWYEDLEEAQSLLATAEDELVEALQRAPAGELDEQVMTLAQRVHTALTIRDGRALTVRHLLEDYPLPEQPATSRTARRTGPVLTATPVPRTAAPVSVPVRSRR
ncbi:hypothetical protein BJP40_03915 [Streptomyces sp. CC53]|uniref:hypothetical protein n=1 Tax=Streptomyces sp. CC53 TaxID=1906740 RepID=UPI0008DE8C3E|nr:hypothetical protein [Streptomyces sp. CC53]OII62155.1 hypothetical protein BJP40_03915 [Streptomyces sp. CC53]